MENPKANYIPPGHQLSVTRPSTLFKIFTRNRISKSKRRMVFSVLFFSIITWPFQLLQRILFGLRWRNIDLNEKPPIFILGHWRSGTTHVHYLFSKDPTLGYLTNFQSFFFNVCALGMGWLNKLLEPLMPNNRPMDNMDMNLGKPQEEEQVISNLSDAASVHSFYFPDNRHYFDKYNLFEGTTAREKRKWQKAYTYALRGIAHMAGGKRLVIKNPNNTGRIKQLLELFPNAKFVYIHRNPYSVYLSTMHLYRVVLHNQSFQDLTVDDHKRIVLHNYERIMAAYERDKALIPEGNLVEVAYDEIGEGSEAMFTRIYKTLGLDSYEQALPHVQAYLKEIKNYKKNKFVPIEEEVVKAIQERWGFIFEKYGYDLEYKDTTKSAQ